MILNGKVSAFFLIMCYLAHPHRIFFCTTHILPPLYGRVSHVKFDSPHSDTKKCTHKRHPKIVPQGGERAILATSVHKPLFNII